MQKILIWSAAIFLSAVAPEIAISQTVYRCVDDNGASTISTRRINKSCKAVPREPINTIPAPDSGNKVYSNRGAGGGAKKVTDPTFPKISTDVQKSRDSDRRHILSQELESEERALKQAQAEFRALPQKTAEEKQAAIPYAERVAQHQRNIENIQKELEKLPQ